SQGPCPAEDRGQKLGRTRADEGPAGLAVLRRKPSASITGRGLDGDDLLPRQVRRIGIMEARRRRGPWPTVTPCSFRNAPEAEADPRVNVVATGDQAMASDLERPRHFAQGEFLDLARGR